MDILGDIVEREPEGNANGETTPVAAAGAAVSGFPELYQPQKVSNWRVRLQQKRSGRRAEAQRTSSSSSGDENHVSEAERIHRENMAYLSRLSASEIEAERQELLNTLSPKLVEALMSAASKGTKSGSARLFAEIEGASGTWVGGSRDEPDIPRLNDKMVDEALGIESVTPEDNNGSEPSNLHFGSHEDEDDIAPQEYQFIESMNHMTNDELMRDVHFVRNSSEPEPLDIQDPDFTEKLHEKYFPDLPKEVDKLEWMKPVTEEQPSDVELIDVAQCRFDFKGNLVPPGRTITSTKTGLHHHADNPNLAGYTIPELEHLSRSTFAAQRCLAIQTLGRILYKMGKQSYYQLVPSVDAQTYESEGGVDGVMEKIYSMFWDLLKTCSVLKSLHAAASESTKNISVRNYAVDALWLWKQGGGDPRIKICK